MASLSGLKNVDLSKIDLSGIRPKEEKKKGFETPGLTANVIGEQATIGRTPELTGLLNTIQSRQAQLGTDIGGLIPQVAPITGRITQSGLEQVESRRRQAIGNLRENLARRRVLGSSFAADAIARTEAQFAKEASDVAARGAMAELQLTMDLLQKQAHSEISGLNTMLSQINLEAGLGAQLSGAATQAVLTALQLQQQQAQFEAQQEQAEAAGLGTAIGVGLGYATGTGPAGMYLGGKLGGSLGGL